MAGTVGVAPGTSTLTLADGTVIQLADWIDDKQYSTVQIMNGQTTGVSAFTTGASGPISGGTRATTLVDTNLTRAGDVGLPQSNEFLIYGIGLKVERVMRPNLAGFIVLPDAPQPGPIGAFSQPPTAQTLFQIDRVIFCEFKYNTKSYTNGLMADYPQGQGISVFSTNPTFELANNGIPSPRDRNALVLPIPLRDGLSYGMFFTPVAAPVINQVATDGGPNLTNADIRATAWGLIKRGVV